MTFRSLASRGSLASLACFASLLSFGAGCSGAAEGSQDANGVSVPGVEGESTPSATSSSANAINEMNAANASEQVAGDRGSNHAASGSSGSSDDDAGTSGATSDAAAPVAPVAIDAGGCPALTYPSGVTIQTFPDATTTASYANHLASGEVAPTCFLDANNLLDPTSGTVYPLTVNVSASFQLEELVGTEIDQGYGHFVLAVPAAVAALEKFREGVDQAVDVISGFRSPKHQEDTCKALCGNPLGCSGTCANNSRHMHGDAFDLPMTFYTSADQTLACTDGFKFSYLESGTHLHVDQNPAYATCVKE